MFCRGKLIKIIFLERINLSFYPESLYLFILYCLSNVVVCIFSILKLLKGDDFFTLEIRSHTTRQSGISDKWRTTKRYGKTDVDTIDQWINISVYIWILVLQHLLPNTLHSSHVCQFSYTFLTPSAMFMYLVLSLVFALYVWKIPFSYNLKEHFAHLFTANYPTFISFDIIQFQILHGAFMKNNSVNNKFLPIHFLWISLGCQQ